MNHVQQGFNECYPAVLAMLSDQPLEAVKRTLLRGTPYDTWQQLMFSSDVARFPQARRIINQNAQSLVPWIPDGALISYRDALPIDIQYADLIGRGTITARRSSGHLFTGHIVAFEDGTIHDPAFPYEMPFALWKILCKMHHAEFLTVSHDPETMNEKIEEAQSEVR